MVAHVFRPGRVVCVKVGEARDVSRPRCDLLRRPAQRIPYIVICRRHFFSVPFSARRQVRQHDQVVAEHAQPHGR
jgi:hypothetical protein